MFRCIACTRQMADERDEEREAGGSRTPSTKQGVKSLTKQIKDMALKFSSTHKQSKPDGTSYSYKKGHRPYTGFDTFSEGVPCPYIGGGSSSSTPAWDFRTSNYPCGRSNPRSIGAMEGDLTPRGRDSASVCDIVLEDKDIETKEWKAEVEPGVHITFVSLPNGGNHLKRIRFSPQVFNKLQAQIWWGENYDRIMELYSVQRYTEQALDTSPKSEDEQRDSSNSRLTYPRESPMALNKDRTPRSHNRLSGSTGYYPSEPLGQCGGHHFHAGSSMEPSRTITKEEHSITSAREMEAEWVEQDEAGIYINIRKLADGASKC